MVVLNTINMLVKIELEAEQWFFEIGQMGGARPKKCVKSAILELTIGKYAYTLISLTTRFSTYLSPIFPGKFVTRSIWLLTKPFVHSNIIICSWGTMLKHLSFSLVGLSNFHPMVSVDLPSEILAQVLYAAFLILGVILLINMLIALLSHTYEQTKVSNDIYVNICSIFCLK